MNRFFVYLKLMRFDKPAGIFLLWFPTAWALWVAYQGMPPSQYLLLFLLGTILMRAAGCVLNDMADRFIDRQVSRTQNRPLASGQLSLLQAGGLLLVLLCLALVLLLMLPWSCFYLALVALAVTVIYPFCKRFIDAPQLVLGLAFSMGIPMVFATAPTMAYGQMLGLILINFLWIVSYDSMYAMADKADDLQIGVRSTAIYFADYDRHIIALLQLGFHFLWLAFAFFSHQATGFYLFWLVAGLILLYQQYLITTREPAACFKAFQVNCYYGALMWLALISSL